MKKIKKVVRWTIGIFLSVSVMVLFQNCGNVTQTPPVEVDVFQSMSTDEVVSKLSLSSEYDDGSVEHSFEVNFDENSISYVAHLPDKPYEPCQLHAYLSDEDRDELLSAYQSQRFCQQEIIADPEMVCTTVLRPKTMLKVESGEDQAKAIRLGIGPCESGTKIDYCEDSSELENVLRDHVESLYQACRS